MKHVLIFVLFTILAVPAAAWDEFLVVTTDYASFGAVTVVDRDAPWTAQPDAETVYADAVARWWDGRYFVVDRGAASLQIIDPAQGYATVDQFSVGGGRNPQDIALDAAGHAWVPCYDETSILKVDLVSKTVLSTVSTAAFADADGYPETGWAQRLGDVIAITCQRLDRDNWWGPADYSQILLLDPALGTWRDADPVAPGVQGIVLAGANPSPMPEPLTDGRRLRVGTTGSFGLLDGGLEIVDLHAGTTSGFLVTEVQLGGDLLDFATVAEDRAYALISTPTFTTSLLSFDPRDGSGMTTIVASSGYDLVDLAWDGGQHLYVCDRAIGAAGVRVFDAATGAELTTAPVGTGLPPFMIALPEAVTTQAPPAPRAALRLAAPFPNPANPSVRIALTAAPSSVVRLEVVDVRGRRVRTASAAVGADGRTEWTWDGTDDTGRPAASGAYSVVATHGRERDAASLTLVR